MVKNIQLKTILRKLLKQLNTVDVNQRTPRINGRAVARKVAYRRNYIRLTIYQEANHAKPHFHIEYKSEYRASYEIDSCCKIVGKMPKKYEKEILKWAKMNTDFLLKTWNALRSGTESTCAINVNSK